MDYRQTELFFNLLIFKTGLIQKYKTDSTAEKAGEGFFSKRDKANVQRLETVYFW